MTVKTLENWSIFDKVIIAYKNVPIFVAILYVLYLPFAVNKMLV